MTQWMLGELPLSRRVTLQVHIACGGVVSPTELRDLGLLLQGIARAVRRWQRRKGADAPAPPD